MTRSGFIRGDQHGVLVLADDVSGAAESAAAFIGRGLGVEVHLRDGLASTSVTVVDLHTRRLTDEDAEQAVTQALSSAEGVRVIIKIDSLLRGHVQATVRAAPPPGARSSSPQAILRWDARSAGEWYSSTESRYPRLGCGEPESTPPPDSIADAVGHTSGVRIADITEDADLDHVVAEATPETILIGTGALTAAVARTMPARSAGHFVAPSSRTVMVVGTADSSVSAQLRELEAQGIDVVRIDCTDLLAGRAATPAPDFVAIASSTARSPPRKRASPGACVRRRRSQDHRRLHPSGADWR